MDYLFAFAMWTAMTGAMMTPVVFPWLRALHRLAAKPPRHRPRPRALPRLAVKPPAGARSDRRPPRPSSPDRKAVALAPFGTGYAVAWLGFSAAAASLHVGLSWAGLPIPLGTHAPTAAAVVVIVAGAFQFTRLKESCLVHCRSPAGYLLAHWQEGPGGWARLGIRHGLYCVGCCWALMALALVVGMASIGWMGLMAAFMAAETALPFGRRLTKPAGVALLVLGTAMLVG